MTDTPTDDYSGATRVEYLMTCHPTAPRKTQHTH